MVRLPPSATRVRISRPSVPVPLTGRQPASGTRSAPVPGSMTPTGVMPSGSAYATGISPYCTRLCHEGCAHAVPPVNGSIARTPSGPVRQTRTPQACIWYAVSDGSVQTR